MKFPAATYRVQLNSTFTLKHLMGIIPYLHQLGVSTIYASPISEAVTGSTHGYDVTDPNKLNPEIGSVEELRQIARQLNALGMTWLQDIVPNHMNAGAGNKRLMDVLERGERSPYYQYFDITWDHTNKSLCGKVLLPILGEERANCLDKDKISLQWQQEGVVLVYEDQSFPVAPGIYEYLLPVKLPYWRDQVDLLFSHWTAPLPQWIQQKEQLLNSVKADNDILQYVQQRIQEINSNKRELVKWLDCQCYSLACWTYADTHMNYRRFFAVNSLISLKMEEPAVFEDYHGLIRFLYNENMVQGVRIDHIDGLYNPQAYISQLRTLLGDDCYIIAEKILEYHESLPRQWQLQGTSGYEFLSFTNQLLTDPEGAEKIKTFFNSWVPDMPPYEDLVFEKKYDFLGRYLGGEWESLVHYLEELEVLQGVAYTRDHLKKALGVWMAAFPVYRIYASEFPIEEQEMQMVRRAFTIAAVKAPDCIEELEVLQTVFESSSDAAKDARKMKFIMRLMQFTGPLAAKGVEDTSFYLYNPLISHNEVGDSPAQLGISVNEFHEKMSHRQQLNPYSLNATSTHDTKRGEDARMRINVLSEMPDEWIRLVEHWHEINEGICEQAGQSLAPSRNDEYMIYQSLIGSFPDNDIIDDTFKQRSAEYIVKALREAKAETTYTQINEPYEQACVTFINEVATNDHFRRSFIPFLQKVKNIAATYSLSQLVIKCTAPGIPDIYQGCELWDNSYVDPDNRRPVNYTHRMQLLHSIIEKEQDPGFLQWLHGNRLQGAEKLFVTKTLLPFRKANQQLFLNGTYLPLQVVNTQRRVIAYARHWQNKWVLIIVPIGIAGAEAEIEKHPIWDKLTVELPEEAPTVWRNLFTGQQIRRENGLLSLQTVFALFPVAVLEA